VRAAGRSDAVGGGIDLERLNAPRAAAWRRGQSPEAGLMSTLEFLPYAWTSNLATWRDVFDRVGGFPEYEEPGEDVDFSWRLQLAGHELRFAPEALVYQRCRTDLRGLAGQFHRYGIAQARLYRDYRMHGARRRAPGAVVRTWARLAVDSRDLVRGPAAMGQWIRRAAYETGQLRGAWRHRVVFAG
jgi:GT2 family glycosyltransferase